MSKDGTCYRSRCFHICRREREEQGEREYRFVEEVKVYEDGTTKRWVVTGKRLQLRRGTLRCKLRI